MKHFVTLEFPVLENLHTFIEATGLINFELDNNIIGCVLTFKQVELAKQYGAKELAEA